jgi:hypothetical protein
LPGIQYSTKGTMKLFSWEIDFGENLLAVRIDFYRIVLGGLKKNCNFRKKFAEELLPRRSQDLPGPSGGRPVEFQKETEHDKATTSGWNCEVRKSFPLLQN